MKYQVIVAGFPGKRVSGSLAWSSVIYVETGRDKILFDTGGPNVRATVRNHLRAVGVQPDEITTLVISHFHDDHVRNFDYFPRAQIVLHADEFAWAQTQPDDFAVPHHLLPALEQTGRLVLVDKNEEVAPGVTTLLVPGHTPGSMALVLQSGNLPVTILTGDAVKNISELATGRADKSHDAAASIDSIKKIRNLAQIVVPGHDRILQVTEHEIIALTAARQTLVVPAGVADCQAERYLELTIEPTTLKKQPIELPPY